MKLPILFLSFFLLFHPSSAQTITIGETNVLSVDDNGNANFLLAQNAFLPQNAIIQSLSFYATNAEGHLRMGIYDAAGPEGGPVGKVAVYDLLGKELDRYILNGSSLQIERGDLEAGIYFITVFVKNERYVVKLILE